LAKADEELQAQQQQLRITEERVQKLNNTRDKLRRELLATPSGRPSLSAQEARQRFDYVTALSLQIEEARQAVFSQRTAVEQAEKRVQQAMAQVETARREVEVLTKHRARQEERFLGEARSREELALDEIGNVLYTTRRRAS
jgi:flagellar biosynthesis chaperone FliJ